MEEDSYQLIKLRPITQNQLQNTSWLQCTKPHQLFYNQDCNRFILNDYKNITIFNKIVTEKFDAGIKGAVQFLSYNQERVAIMYHSQKQGIIIKYLMNQSQIKIKDAKQIIHIQWLSSQCQADCIIVQQNGIRFIKLTQDKKGYKEMKYLSMKINACWFQWQTETLVTCSYYQRGVLNIFSLRDAKNKNLYKTGTLQLKFKEDFVIVKKTDKNIKFKVASTRSHQPLFAKTFPESFQIQVFNIYQVPIIIVLNLMAGLLDFYQIEGTEGNKLSLAVNLPTDSPAILNVYDRLVLIHLKNDHISFVYDIKRSGTQPVATPAAIGVQQIYGGQILNRWVLTPNKQVYKWDLQPKAIFRYIKNEGEIFLFLMRRRNSKMIILTWIRQNLFKFKATLISNFLKIIFVEHTDSVRSGDKHFIEQSISPIDTYANIFYPLQTSDQKQRLLDIMLQAQRQLSINKLQTPPKFQQLIIQFLLQFKKQLLLSQLIQSKLIQQSKQLALNLYEQSIKSDKKQVLQQVCVDILYRKGCFKELINIFAQLGYISQIIKIVRRYHQKIPLQVLINLYKSSSNDNKQNLKAALKDLGRELYPISQQFMVSQIDKSQTINNNGEGE